MKSNTAGSTTLSRIRRTLVLALFFVLMALGVAWILTTPGMRPIVISPYEDALLKPDETTHDLGVIPTDSRAEHTFHLYNIGGKPLRLYDVETSCGCTVAELSHKVLHPGEFARLKVAIDTSIKLGKIKKRITIRSNDPQHPEFKLYLTGKVVQQLMGHAPIAVKDPLVLFKGKCAACHVDRGKGKAGKELFIADCAMCHGINGEGHKDIAPSLLVQNYADEKTVARIRRVIAEGSPRSPEMPPFSQAKGGPLTDGEIDSLVNFLKFQSEQAKLGLLNQDAVEEDPDAE